MQAIAPLPPKSRIQIEREGDQLELVWSHPKNDNWVKIPLGLVLVVAIGFWAICGLFLLTILIAGILNAPNVDKVPPSIVAVFGFLVIAIMGICFASIPAISLLARVMSRDRPARLSLGAETLHFDPGRRFVLPNHWQPDRHANWPTPPPERTLSRSKLSGIQLAYAGDRQRLSIDHGIERVEIGESLHLPDREWLCEVLRAWLGTPVDARLPTAGGGDARSERQTPPELAGLEPLPLGARIQIERAPAEFVLSWSHPPIDYWIKLPARATFWTWVCGWCVMEVFVICVLAAYLLGGGPLVRQGDPGGVGFLLVWLMFWTIMGPAAIRMHARNVLPERPARLVLGIDRLQYDPGRHFHRPENPWHSYLGHGLSMTPVHRACTLTRGEIDSVQLVFTGGRQRLWLVRDSVRWEIGLSLSEPEREWLARALDNWFQRRDWERVLWKPQLA